MPQFECRAEAIYDGSVSGLSFLGATTQACLESYR
jgi:hypothetical protein